MENPDAFVIDQTDSDRTLSSGIMSGGLEPRFDFDEAASAAEPGSEENEMTDQLQTQPHFRTSPAPSGSLRFLRVSGRPVAVP